MSITAKRTLEHFGGILLNGEKVTPAVIEQKVLAGGFTADDKVQFFRGQQEVLAREVCASGVPLEPNFPAWSWPASTLTVERSGVDGHVWEPLLQGDKRDGKALGEGRRDEPNQGKNRPDTPQEGGARGPAGTFQQTGTQRLDVVV